MITRRTKKAQASFEFYISTFILVIAFTAALAIIYGTSVNLFQMEDWLTAKYISQKLAFAMNKVYVAGDGAVYTITLEDMAGRTNISIENGQITVSRAHAIVSSSLLTNQVNASTINSTDIVIRNNNGVLEIG